MPPEQLRGAPVSADDDSGVLNIETVGVAGRAELWRFHTQDFAF